MTSARRWAASGLVGAATLAAGCGGPTGVATLGTEARAAPPVARVATVASALANLRRVTEQPGQIEAVEVTPLHAKLAGYVRSVSADIGDRVRAGAVMAELRVPEVEADAKQKRAMLAQAEAEKAQAESSVAVAKAGVMSAEARVAEAQAGIRRVEADVARWESEYGRIQQLFRERAQTGSLLDETRNKKDAAEAARDEIRARVRSAEAALTEARALEDKARADVRAADSHVEVARFEAERADAMAGYARIEAPYDGIVTRRRVEVGQLTTPGTTGEPLFVVARAGVVTITVGVPETEAPFVNAGDAAQVRLAAQGGRAFEGKVARTSWALDPATRTLAAEVDLPNVDEALLPGLYAYATIVAEERRDVLTVPTTALVKDGGKTYCVAVEGGHARRREVQVGLVDGKRVEVLSGLAEGEAVVEANAASLVDGQPVERAAPPAPGTNPKN